ncbi:MAG: hypothetical protein A2Y63_03405 [Candidatus Riflebacteria bacterium RBG_13_59_9]|nr:MAG: hypothetical protein A2Y63_03405 [Candidatus Riflebacteria bacterium RBG_13_59_9]
MACIAVVFVSVLLLGMIVRAQDVISNDEASRIMRETPLNVPELIEKVKRGVVVVHPISITDPIAAQAGIMLGSGFVIDKQGHIITNDHVAGSASMAQIIFWDGSSARATLVAAAPYYDVALLKLDDPEPDKLFPVTLGDSNRVQPGELALAMGSPGANEGFNIDRSDPFEYWGLRQTATMRVVTGRDTDLAFAVGWNYRNRYGGGGQMGLSYALHYPYVLRMQVPINGGNSGGPLFNSHGEVIGINTYGGAWMLDQQSNIAVPINLAKNFVVEVLEHKRQDIPWLGVHCIFPPNILDPESYVEFRERMRPEGLWVYKVEPDSPAAQAGLADGDQITSVNGEEPPTPESFRTRVLLSEIGEEYVFSVTRGNKEFTVHLYTVPKPAYVLNFSV